MIVKPSQTSNTALFVIPEDADDLFALRRLVEQGDSVIADTARAVKQESEYGRPDKGERVKVRLTIRVEKIELDSSVGRLRVAGIITSSSNELVSKGTHHAISIQTGDPLTIDKHRRLKDVELKMLKKAGDDTSFILVAIDTQEAAVAKVSGTHVKMIPNIYSGQSGKRYQTKNTGLDAFFSDIAKLVTSVLEESDKVIIFGPGETRRRFYNSLGKYGIPNERARVVDGVDVAGEDGIFVFLRSAAMREVMNTSKLAIVSSILDKVMLMVSRGENKFAMGIKEVQDAISMKAVETIILSDSIFEKSDEGTIVKMLNSAESYGAKTYAVDASTDIGLRVSSLGGIVALLRFAMR